MAKSNPKSWAFFTGHGLCSSPAAAFFHFCVQVQECIKAGNATQALKEYAIMTGTFW